VGGRGGGGEGWWGGGVVVGGVEYVVGGGQWQVDAWQHRCACAWCTVGREWAIAAGLRDLRSGLACESSGRAVAVYGRLMLPRCRTIASTTIKLRSRRSTWLRHRRVRKGVCMVTLLSAHILPQTVLERRTLVLLPKARRVCGTRDARLDLETSYLCYGD
jgi:hypothetical protein